MPTFDFNITAVDLVKAALRICGALEESEEPDAAQLQDGIEALNMMMKFWQTQGVHLWRKKEGVLFLENDQARYLLGPTGNRAAEDDDFIETAMDGAQLSGATSITVDSTAGMAPADVIGIKTSTTTRHWTTIVSVDTATTLTITTGLPSNTVDNASVYTYTTQLERPLRILHGRRRAGGPTIGEIPTFPMSRNLYHDLTNRSQAKGLPVEHHYTPLTGNGELFLWPVPNNVDFLFKFTFSKPLADIDTNSDFTDFPQEWLLPLKWNLASEIMPEYRLGIQERQLIQTKADTFLKAAMDFDRENAPFIVMPETRQRY